MDAKDSVVTTETGKMAFVEWVLLQWKRAKLLSAMKYKYVGIKG